MPESDGSIPADCDGDTEGKPLLLPRLPELLVLLVPVSPLLVPLPPMSGVDAPTTAHGDGDREATPLLPPLLQSCHRGCWCCQCHCPGGGGEGPDRAQRQTVVRKRLQRRGPLQRRKQAALHAPHGASSPSLSSCRSVVEKAWACASTSVLKAATYCATTSIVPLVVSCRTATMSATIVVTSEERLEPQNHVHNAVDIVHDRRQHRRAPPRVRQGHDLGDGGGQAHEHCTLDGGQAVVNQPLLDPRDLLHAVQKRSRSTRLSPQHADPPAPALGPMERAQNNTPPPTN